MEKNKIIGCADGGSRGNPGRAALGVYFPGLKKEYSEYLGTMTNNEAEYSAALFALKKIKALIGKEAAKKAEVELKMDSELVVKQMNGEYKIKEENLQKFFMELWNLKLDFKKVSFTHIRREQNAEADRLVNEELDRQDKNQRLL